MRGVTDFRMNYSRHQGESTWSQAGIAPDSCYLRPVTAALTFADICESYFRYTIAGLGPAAIGREGSHRQQQWNLVANASVMLGGHQLRFGADYRRLEPMRIASGTTVSAIAESLQDLLATTNLFVAVSPPAKYVSDLEEISLFGQDSWRLGKRLTLTYGVRWDFDPPPTTAQPLFGLESATGQHFGNPVAVPIWQARRTNFEPRAGFAYRLTPSGRTVVRGGLGLYLDSALSVASDLVNGGPFNVFQLGNPAASGTGLARIVLGYGFAPDLRLPAVWQASAALEHAFADRDVVSLTYAGARGRALLRRELDGLDPTQRVRAVLTTNHGASEYHALQLQYRRRMANHVQALAGYSAQLSIRPSPPGSRAPARPAAAA